MKVATLALVACLAPVAGCNAIRDMMPAARKAEAAKLELQRMQARNMRFADEYVGGLIEAEGPRRQLHSDPERRLLVSGWVLSQASAAYITASGDDPVIATLDLLTLAVLSRMVADNFMAEQRFTEIESLVAAHRRLETEAWKLAATILDPRQQESVRTLFAEWRRRNPDFQNVSYVRFVDFAEIIGNDAASSKSGRSGGLFTFLGLDPLAGLDPAVEEIERTRLLAARAVYYAQRVPTLMDLQLERSLSLVASGPGIQKLQQQSAVVADSATRFADVAERLPEVIAGEREALVRQMYEALGAHRATLQPMLVELRGALEAGDATATSVDAAVKSIDALVARFSQTPGSVDAESGRPFDITEYTQAAVEIGRAARELQELADALEARAPRLDAALGTGLTRGQSLVDYLFVRLAGLIVLLCLGLLATLLLYRRLAQRTSAGR